MLFTFFLDIEMHVIVCLLCVCACVCKYLLIYVYIHAYMYVYIYICICQCVCAYKMLGKHCPDESSLDFFSRLPFFCPLSVYININLTWMRLHVCYMCAHLHIH